MISVVSLAVRIPRWRGRLATERERVRDGLVAEGAGGQGEADGAIRTGLGWVGQGLLRQLQVRTVKVLRHKYRVTHPNGTSLPLT